MFVPIYLFFLLFVVVNIPFHRDFPMQLFFCVDLPRGWLAPTNYMCTVMKEKSTVMIGSQCETCYDGDGIRDAKKKSVYSNLSVQVRSE